MPSTGRLVAGLALAALLATLAATSTARASGMDKLLDLLVKKGTITEGEAAALREDIRQEEVAEQAQAFTRRRAQETEKKEHPTSGATPIKVSGYVQARWTGAVGTTNPFEMRRARVSLDGVLGDRVSYKIQADTVKNPALLDARLGLALLPYAKLSVGQFKVPFSSENLLSSRDLITVERSQVGNKLVPGRDLGSSGRDIGTQLEGRVVRGNGKPLLSYAVGIFNGAGINRLDDNRRKDFAGRIVAQPFSGLEFAGNYYDGASGANRANRERAGLEFGYERKTLLLRGEYIWGRDDAIRRRGWYALGAYRFRPRWEGVFRFDTFDPDRTARPDSTDVYLVGVNWYLSRWVKWQLNYGLADAEARDDLTNVFLSQLQFQF